MRKCPNCGKENKPSANFCGGCGTRLPEDAPAGIQMPENRASAARPAAGTPGGKKRTWMKAAVPILILIIAVFVFRKAGPAFMSAPACETCGKILELQNELQSVMAENQDNSLTMVDYEQWNIKVTTLSNEIQLLKDHECDAPIREVKNQTCSYGRYLGSYTGEWKSTMPYGEGVFSGSYMDGSTQYACTYSGTWSGGVPNGAGSMLEDREYLGDSNIENWASWLYGGTFVDGKLTGNGWVSFESSSGDRYEYFDGVYHNGYLEGQANFLHYRDGDLYDKGVAEGSKFIMVYSERQELLDTLQTVAGIAVVGLGAKWMFDMIDSALGPIDPNSSAGRWLETRRAELAADIEMQQEKRAKEETEKQLYDTWQAHEAQAKWCETSKYTDEQKWAEYHWDEADKAQEEYEAFKRAS